MVEVVGGEDVDVAVGTGSEEVDFGVCGVGFFHVCEVAVGFENGSGKLEFQGGDIFSPRHGVEQSAPYQFRPSDSIGKILIEHQQVVAKIEIGLARVRVGERAAAEMIDTGVADCHNLITSEHYAPAEVDFLHMGEKRGVESTDFAV